MTTIPTIETLAEQAEARGQTLGALHAPTGRYMDDSDANKHISDLMLLYMVFLDDEDTDSEICVDYIRSEFLLGYAIGFMNGQVN
jgi:hypothetical protein